MGLVVPLLALPFFGGGVLAMWWIARRLPEGWKGICAGFCALCAFPPLVLGGWWLSLHLWTSATYVCLDCGRTEVQERFAGVICSRTLLDDGEDYAERFAVPDAAGYGHDWQLESCLHAASGRITCSEQCVEGWFRVLPRLRDRDAADQLFRSARALPHEQRCALMDEITRAVWNREQGEDGLDRAFASWCGQRR
jgi:hypothetical protein